MYGSDMYGSDMYGSDMYGSDMYGSDMHGSDMHGSDMYGSDMHGSDMYGSDMHGSDMYDLITCRHICIRVLGCCSFYVSHLSCVDKSGKKDDTCTQQEYDVDVIVLCNIEKKNT